MLAFGVMSIESSSSTSCLISLSFDGVGGSSKSNISLSSSVRIESESSWSTGCEASVDLPTKIGSPDFACSSGDCLLARDRLNLENVGLTIRGGGGWTIIVSSSTEVASVLVWPSVPDGERLLSRDAAVELEGDGWELKGCENDGLASSILTKGLGRAFLNCLDGVSRLSSSRFLFRGVSMSSLGSIEGDLPSGDDS